MTIGAEGVPAEEAARAHLETRHPAVSVAYAADVPHRTILSELQEVGICTCRIVSSRPGEGTDTSSPRKGDNNTILRLARSRPT